MIHIADFHYYKSVPIDYQQKTVMEAGMCPHWLVGGAWTKINNHHIQTTTS